MSSNGKDQLIRISFNRGNYFQFINNAPGVIKPFNESLGDMQSYEKDVPWSQRQVNRKVAQNFLQTLFPGNQQWQTYADAPCQIPPITDYGTLDKFVSKIVPHNQQGMAVTMAINRTDGQGKKKENIIAARALFADLDGAPLLNLIAFPLVPHAINETSPGRYQVFYLVKGMPLEQFPPCQIALAQLVEGDESVSDINRGFRVPGFLNSKEERDKIFRSRMRYLRQGKPYSWEEVQKILGSQVQKTKDLKKKAVTSVLFHKKDKVSEKIHKGKRKSTLISWAGRMLKLGCDAGEAMCLVRYWSEHNCVPPLKATELESLEQSISKYAEQHQEKQARAHLPTFIWEGHLINEGVKTAEETLQGLKKNRIYNRGDQPVIVKPIRTKRGKVYRSVVVDKAYLVARLTKLVNWVDKNGDSIPCPGAIVNTLLSPAHIRRLPPLNSIIVHPTMRLDGTILDQPGYDDATGIYLVPGCSISIKENPTLQDAKRALKRIRRLYRYFPFAGRKTGKKIKNLLKTADESVIIATNMALIECPIIDSLPLTITSAPTPRSGKDLLLEVMGLMVTGNIPSSTSYKGDEVEDAKKIFSALRRASSLYYMGNVKNGMPIESDTFCNIITGSSYGDRVLQESRDEEYPANILLVASGNNIQVKGELAVRTLRCHIDSGMEHPEKRKLDKNKLYRYIQKFQLELLTAHLTILRAYQLACQKDEKLITDPGRTGRPLDPWGGFEGWDRLIRRALIWVGMPDPCLTRLQVEEEEIEHEEGNEILAELQNTYHEGCGFTNKMVCHDLDPDNGTSCGKLQEALLPLVKNRQGKPDAYRLRSLLSKLKNRPINGKKLIKISDRNGAKWDVVFTEKQ